MSRVGRKPVQLGPKVTVACKDAMVTVVGPMGRIERALPEGVALQVEKDVIRVVAPAQRRGNRGFQGLTQALLSNWVKGVSSGFERSLEINGVGYKFELRGKNLGILVGFSHPVDMPVPEGLKVVLDKSQTKLKIAGHDNEVVGQFAASVRAIRPCEPYKGKGIKYDNEVIRRKAGKAGSK